MALLLGLDPTGIPARVVAELDSLVAALQTWVGKQEGLNDTLQTQQAGLEGKLVAVPTGGIIEWSTTTAPTGWLLCNGAAVDRTTYGALFAVIGVTYGTGNGSTTFNVPDCRGRFGLGLAASGTGSTLGGTGGAIDHTHTGGTVSGSTANSTAGIAGSTASESSHIHAVSGVTAGPSSTQTAAVGVDGPYAHQTHTHTITFNTGAGQAHSHGVGTLSVSNHLHGAGTLAVGASGTANPPFIAMPRIIKT